MDAEAIVSVSAAVVALTQLCKWAGLADRRGPLAVIALSLVGVGVWAFSRGDFARTTLFNYFAGWVAVTLSAAGVFGFSRAMPQAVSSFTPPPGGGAGSNPTG